MEKGVIKFLLFICLIFSSAFVAEGQVITPPLERTISVEFNRVPIKDALIQIEDSADFSFAYKTGAVDESIVVNRSYNDKTIREILDDIFQGTVSYRGKGNYVLLKKAVKSGTEGVVLDGYVVDVGTKEKIPFATIYDVNTLSSAVSDEYGHYFLEIGESNDVNLKVKKAGYEDEEIHFVSGQSPLMTIYLNPIVPVFDSNNVQSESDTNSVLKRIQTLKWLKISPERKAHFNNFEETMKGKVQFSVVPNVGTNGKLSSSTVVDYSFNLFGGFVGGVRKLEIASIFNIDADSVSYAQFAGVFNVVGGPQNGFQAAGVFNTNLSDFNGVQMAGFSNLVKQDLKGTQFAGFGNNVLGTSNGIQGAGFYNLARDSSKVGQFAGFYNHIGHTSYGTQAAGFMNFAEYNYTGVQVAGFMNLSLGHQKGAQVAGFLNVANKITGSQIGFINVNDSIAGVPIGFLSFSRKGLHQLEISTNESMPIQIAYKTGVHSFYNSILLSARFEQSNQPIFGLGYGLGSSVKLNDKNRIFFDVQGTQLLQKTWEPNSLSKLTISYQYQLKKNLAIAIGPSLNVLQLYDTNLTATQDLKRLAPYNFYEYSTTSGRLVQMWVGGHLAIRFF